MKWNIGGRMSASVGGPPGMPGTNAPPAGLVYFQTVLALRRHLEDRAADALANEGVAVGEPIGA